MTLGIRIADGGGLISRCGLYSIYIAITKNFSCFSRDFLKETVFFESCAITSYDFCIREKGFDCIPKRFTIFFAFIFRKQGHFVAFIFLVLGQEAFLRKSLKV